MLIQIVNHCGSDSHLHRSINLADTDVNLGVVERNLGNLQKALEYYEKALEIYLKSYGGAHVNKADTYLNKEPSNSSLETSRISRIV